MRIGAALVLVAYLLPLVDAVPLMEDDEGLHAAIAQEMVERGDWVVPRLMGEPFLDKPILYFWMEAGAIAAFGATEFAVRLPGPLLGLAGALATGWLARVLFGASAGLGAWAALAYATMALPFAVTLAPLHDLVMVPLVALALGAFWRAHHAESAGRLAGWTAAAGIALGLSMLGKGLTGAGLVGVGMVAWMAWTRTFSPRLVAVGAVALAVGCLLAWPWYAAMEAASPGYLRYFILDRHVGGVAGEAQRHGGRPFWYYLPILAAGTWPWIVAAARRSIARADRAERLVWSWLLADLVLLSVAGSKLPTYLLPAFPAVALLAARVIVESRPDDAPVPGWTAWPTAVLPLAGVAFFMLAVPLVGAAARTGVALVPLGLAGGLAMSAAGRRWSIPERLLAVTAVTLLATGLTVRPLAAVQLTARSLADDMNRTGRMPRQLLVIDEGVGSFLFYLRPDLRRGLTPDRVQRVSRFSLGDDRAPDDVLVAIAADRIAGVREMYDLPASPDLAAGRFHVVPFSSIRRRQP